MKIVVITGGFDPIHSGHIAYIQEAAKLGDRLMIGLNSDAWLERKKGRAFMPWNERAAVLQNIKGVSNVLAWDDCDGSACKLLEELKFNYVYADIIFANGGDRTKENIPEMNVRGINFMFGVGGEDKKNSSSWILQEWKEPKTDRQWGYYRTVYDQPGTKVKELTVEPGKSLSMQKHENRSEYWHVVSGRCIVEQQMPNGYQIPARTLEAHESIQIPVNEWHKLVNPFDEPCRIVEIQYGTSCTESDITRKD